MVIAAAGTTGITPRGPAIDVWLNLVHVASIFLATPTRGHHGKHYYYEQDKFREKNILESFRCQGPEKHICKDVPFNKAQDNVIYLQKKCPARWGGLRVFGFTLERLDYGAHNIFNADPGGFRRFFDELQGDAGVTALEAHQHMLSLRMCQSVALLL
jgi:hypothetical protein